VPLTGPPDGVADAHPKAPWNAPDAPDAERARIGAQSQQRRVNCHPDVRWETHDLALGLSLQFDDVGQASTLQTKLFADLRPGASRLVELAACLQARPLYGIVVVLKCLASLQVAGRDDGDERLAVALHDDLLALEGHAADDLRQGNVFDLPKYTTRPEVFERARLQLAERIEQSR
jgi:hypothetical protein